MITGEIRSKVDRIWDTMWLGGISNPLSVVERLPIFSLLNWVNIIRLKERKAA